MMAAWTAAWLGYVVNFLGRYFLIGGSAALLLHWWWAGSVARFRVQPIWPAKKELWFEIQWGIVNGMISGITAATTAMIVTSGRSAMYFDIADHGWAYLVASIPLGLLAYDTWFYWSHRLLHTDWLFHHAHFLHHRILNPSVFAAYSHHPIETLFGNSFFFLLVLLVPLHPLALAGIGGVISVAAHLLHSGFEIAPSGALQHPVLRWIGTATHHNLHHSEGTANFGSLLNVWDTVAGTNHPEYRNRFAIVTARRETLAGRVSESAERE